MEKNDIIMKLKNILSKYGISTEAEIFLISIIPYIIKIENYIIDTILFEISFYIEDIDDFTSHAYMRIKSKIGYYFDFGMNSDDNFENYYKAIKNNTKFHEKEKLNLELNNKMDIIIKKLNILEEMIMYSPDNEQFMK